MLPQEIIRLKRDGQTLTEAQIEEFIAGVTTGAVTEGQVAAFCMATLLRGMTMTERVTLTKAMAHSGTMLTWDVHPVLDKHSTGGVGDKTSLVLAPIIAACGGYVPMLSGRGLGHTGGTLDKFDSIPGYQTQPSSDLFRKTVREVGCAIIGQTADLAPADKRVYSIRDTTATVESIDLITASILSKKLAAGLDALVMDVKFGSGAFMSKTEDAEALAQSIATVATGAGVKTTALLTDMNQVLGRTAGNALEMRECVDWLVTGKAEARLTEVTLALCAEMLVLGGLARDTEEAWAKCETVLANGKAAEKFAQMVTALGGASDFLEKAERYLPQAPVVRPVMAAGEGFVSAMNVYEIGMAVVALGGGRTDPKQAIDHSVGFSDFIQIGERADKPLALVHARTEAEAEVAATRLRLAITLSEMCPLKTPILGQKITPSCI